MTARIAAIAVATFKEALRDKLLALVVVFAIALVLFSRVLGWLSVEDEVKMVQDFSLTGMSLLSLFLAMLVGANSLAREVERRTVYTVLTRTGTRTEFILGKFAGLVGVFWLCLFGAGGVLALWVMTWGGSVGEALGLPSATLSFHLKELKSAGLIRCERLGRSRIYSPDFERMSALVAFLSENCCEGIDVGEIGERS